MVSKKVSPFSSKIIFCIIDALYELLKEVKGGPKDIEGFKLTVMPICMHAWI